MPKLLARLKVSTPSLGTKAGDLYFCQSYRFDPAGKVTLFRRYPDGHDPECNEYRHNVEFVPCDTSELVNFWEKSKKEWNEL